MVTDIDNNAQKRVLVVAPTARDGEITRAILMNAGVGCCMCKDLLGLTQEIEAGAGAVLLTEEVVAAVGIDDLLTALNKQPPWSDLPVVMMMRGLSDSPAAARFLNSLANVTLLERPAPVRSVVSAVQAALRARERQYQIRDQLHAIRQAELRSQELQQQIEIAIHASQIGTFYCEMPLAKIIWNDRCKAQFWLPPDAEIDFDLFYSILHPDDRERTRQAVEACVYGGKGYDIEYRAVSPKGEIRWIRSTGRTYYDAENEPVRFDGTTVDITERKRTEEELLESQQRFQAMANAIPQLAWMAKPDGWIFWYNQRWHAYCGTTPGQMEGWDWRSVHDPQELPRVIKKWKAALASGEPWEDTFPLRRHDGEFRWHLSRAMPFRDASGNITLWFGTNTDITEAREKTKERQQLLESERAARQELERLSRTKDEFLATLSHELRTPLNTILGWTQLLKRGKNDPEKLAQGIDVIDRNVRLQAQLIEDLLDVSRIVSGKVHLEVQKVELPDIISAAIEAVLPAAQAKGIRLETVINPLASPISADPGRLQQVLWNLLSNAIKFTPNSGEIHVLAERVDSHVEISVTDTGEGISADFLPHLFARFSQADSSTRRKHGGLGLGLSIVKNLGRVNTNEVRRQSGQIG
jgi:PAS domain S-box-containing protein